MSKRIFCLAFLLLLLQFSAFVSVGFSVGEFDVTVKNAVTKEPIPYALVTIGDKSALTSSNGMVAFKNIEVTGWYDMTVSKEYYFTDTRKIFIVADPTLKTIMVELTPTGESPENPENPETPITETGKYGLIILCLGVVAVLLLLNPDKRKKE